MEKLNELAYRAERYLLTKSESQPEQINVSCKTILAIAEAFRALEKRAEAAEAQLICNVIYQVRLLDGEENCSEWVEVTEEEFNTPTTEKYGKWEHRKLFTRPAPAADLAELVPDEMTPKQASRSYGGEVVGYRDGWNACRAAILRKIEEAK